ncbi:MAG: hypothetical protein RLY16_2589 [Bacteroidota bacterium]
MSMYKLFFILIALLPLYSKAQYGDAYHAPNTMEINRNSQARQTAEMNRHYESMRPSRSGSTSIGNVSSGSATPFDFSVYKKPSKTLAEIENEKRLLRAKERRLDSMAKVYEANDKAWEAGVDNYNQNLFNGNNSNYSFDTRLYCLNKAAAFIDSVNNQIKAVWKEQRRRSAPPLNSLDIVNYVKAALYLEHKKYANAYTYFKLCEGGTKFSDVQINKIKRLAAYCALIVEPDKGEVLKKCNALQLADSLAIHYKAYAYFLNQQPDSALNSYSNFIAAHPELDHGTSLNIQSACVALYLLQGNKQAALALYNSKSTAKVNSAETLKKIIADVLLLQVTEDMAAYDFNLPVWTLFQLDLLCLLTPENKTVIDWRAKLKAELK